MADTCKHCGLEIKPHEPRFARDEWKGDFQHYDCWRAAGGRTSFDDAQDMKKKFDEFQKKLDDLRSRLRGRR